VVSEKTKKNLWEAFAGESMARNKYVRFAKVAKKEGHQAIEKIFLETAENEVEHAGRIAKLLGNGVFADNTSENLKRAFDGETYEWTDMYPRFFKDAKANGDEEAAAFFENITKAESHHAKRYARFKELLDSGKLYEDDEEVYWFCTNCGHIHKGRKAPEECPTCKHPQGYFVRKCMLEYGEEK